MMDGQLSIFDFVEAPVVFQPGDITENEKYVGKEIEWSKLLACFIGQKVWLKHILESLTYYECVIPENYLIKEITYYKNGVPKLSDRVICYDGQRQRLLIDEYLTRSDFKYPGVTMFYEIATLGENDG